MNSKKPFDKEKLPVDVSELGELLSAEIKCPGVYYLAVRPEGDYGLFPMEYYLVLDGAPSHRRPKNTAHHLKMVRVSSSRWSKTVAARRSLSTRYTNTDLPLPLPEGESLHGCAVYAAELYPEYFGMLSVPALTPWCYTTWHRALASGIYWIETGHCVEVLAVSHPAWAADLSGSVLRHAHQTDYDMEHGMDRTFGYQFFSKKVSCVVIFELLQCHSEWLTNGLVNLLALMNASLKYWPEYTMTFNSHEQAGLNDGVGLFLRSTGIEVELSSLMERMTTLTPGAGIEFLRWK